MDLSNNEVAKKWAQRDRMELESMTHLIAANQNQGLLDSETGKLRGSTEVRIGIVQWSSDLL